jgi:rhodanese-related sulfurtransferase
VTRADDIDPQEAAARIAAGQVRVIDVREDDEWAEIHLDVAEHRPLGALEPASVPADRPILIICRSGRRSGLAADRLAQTHDVTNIAGGLQAWSDQGLPLAVQPDAR